MLLRRADSRSNTEHQILYVLVSASVAIKHLVQQKVTHHLVRAYTCNGILYGAMPEHQKFSKSEPQHFSRSEPQNFSMSKLQKILKKLFFKKKVEKIEKIFHPNPSKKVNLDNF